LEEAYFSHMWRLYPKGKANRAFSTHIPLLHGMGMEDPFEGGMPSFLLPPDHVFPPPAVRHHLQDGMELGFRYDEGRLLSLYLSSFICISVYFSLSCNL
jgi:hypothetical protein